MSNTIELLESIGTDASLRHASGEDMARTLAGMQASEALTMAAMSGDRNHLTQELGPGENKPPNSPTNTGYGDGDGEGDEDPQEQEHEGKAEY